MLIKERKKKQKLINTNVITRHNAIAITPDRQSWRSNFSLIQTCLQFFQIKIENVAI